jgi:CHAD domain-containing protein
MTALPRGVVLNPEARSHPDRSSPLLKQRIRGVFRQLPRALAGDEEAVHQMRVAGRRLRVALPLLARKPEGRRVERALEVLRELTRTAGASRDLDVGLVVLEERLQVLEHPHPEQLGLRRRLRAARTRSRGRMAEALLDLEIARLRRDLRAIVARRAEDVFTVLARLRELRDRDGAMLLGGFGDLGGRFDPVALHGLRRRARRLRYAAEMSDLLRGESSGAPELWKRLQDHIGELHDRHVLSGWLLTQSEAMARRGQSAAAATAIAEHQFFVQEARRLHRELFASRPDELVGHALAAMGAQAA